MSKPILHSDVRPSYLPSLRAEDVTRAFQDAVREALQEHARAGNDVPTLQDGQVVWVSPAKLLADASDAETHTSPAAAEH